MLSKIILNNFKLFSKSTPIPLSNINLLTGVNGRGKSTVLQSFLLMKQSPEFDRTTDKLVFNGNYVKLGNIKNIKNIASSIKNPIEFQFCYSYKDINFSIQYNFISESDNSLDANIVSIIVKNLDDNTEFIIYKKNSAYIIEKGDSSLTFPYLFNFFVRNDDLDGDVKKISSLINLSKVHYISADRIGPKLYYNKHSLEEFATIGAEGQNTVNVLWNKRGDRVFENLCINKDLPKTVIEQANYWFGQIFEEAKLNVDEIKDTDLLSLTFSSSNNNDYFVPTNVGFGYSYVLPIIISGLIAKENEILLIENPECHLHPYAQSILSKFLTLVSANNIQIFIESHSEHILNGFRISVKDKLINKTDLNVLYFDHINDQFFEKINVDEDGGISNWPRNFFDQSTKDLNYLLGI